MINYLIMMMDDDADDLDIIYVIHVTWAAGVGAQVNDNLMMMMDDVIIPWYNICGTCNIYKGMSSRNKCGKS